MLELIYNAEIPANLEGLKDEERSMVIPQDGTHVTFRVFSKELFITGEDLEDETSTHVASCLIVSFASYIVKPNGVKRKVVETEFKIPNKEANQLYFDAVRSIYNLHDSAEPFHVLGSMMETLMLLSNAGFLYQP